MSKRWKLKQDDDCHWYLIKQDDDRLFDALVTSEDECEFERIFGGMRTSGPHALTFERPMEE